MHAAAGISNVVTALFGAGMTGSYIFSQTVFSMKAGIKTRVHGAIIAGKRAARCIVRSRKHIDDTVRYLQLAHARRHHYRRAASLILLCSWTCCVLRWQRG